MRPSKLTRFTVAASQRTQTIDYGVLRADVANTLVGFEEKPAMQYLVTYLHRLKGPALARIQEDMQCILDYAKQQGWNKQQQTFLKSFLGDYGIGGKG